MDIVSCFQEQGAIVSQCFQRRAGEADVFSCFHEEDAVLALDGDAGGGMQHILVLCMQHGVLHGDVVICAQRYLLFRMDDTTLFDVMRGFQLHGIAVDHAAVHDVFPLHEDGVSHQYASIGELVLGFYDKLIRTDKASVCCYLFLAARLEVDVRVENVIRFAVYGDCGDLEPDDVAGESGHLFFGEENTRF